MAVLILGGYGLIGSAILARLRAEGIDVAGLGRKVAAARARWPEVDWRQADLARLTTPEDWAPLLAGVEAVVNAAGVLQQGLGDDVAAVQDRAMAALYAAARAAGVRRIVQISAVGAERNAATEFMRSKARADAALRDSGVAFAILRPGLVISPVAYGGTALLRGLAAFPGMTPLVLADSRIQTVHVEEVAEAAAAAVRGAADGQTLDLVERPGRSLAETVALFRGWLGLPKAPRLRLPDGVGRLVGFAADGLGWLGWRSPLRSTALAVMRSDVAGDPAGAVRLLGREARTLPQILASLPAGPQERWFARLWLARPLILGGLAAFWIASGLIGLVRLEAAEAVLTSRGAPQELAALAAAGGGVADVLLGLGALVRPSAGAALLGMIGLSLAYLAGAAAFAPDLWLDPLGPMVKVIPALILAVVGLAILEAR